MKKALYLVIALLLCTVLLAGCGGGGGGIPQDDNVITIGLPKQIIVESYGDDNALTAWLEEKTGYDIEIIEFATGSGDYKTQLATMVASGETLPDILFSFDLGDSLRSSYGQQGYFIDLKPYYDNKEKSAPLWERINAMEEQTRQWMFHKLEDPVTGAYYAFPNGNANTLDNSRYIPWINQNWLDALGLPVPQNVDQLVETLRAFRDRDPNGNKEKDEIPCMGNTSNMGGDVISWFINMKMQMDMTSWINIDSTGKGYAPAVTDEYRDAIKWIHDLMAEGLIHPGSVTTSSSTLRKNLAAGDLIGLALGHPTNLFANYEDIAKWTPVPIFSYAFYEESTLTFKTFITEDCDNPDAAWEIMMLFYTQEGEYRCRFGEPGIHWDYADEGGLNAFGEPALMKIMDDLYTATKTNSFWRVFCCLGTVEYSRMVQVGDNTSDAEKAYWDKVSTFMNNYAEATKMDTGNITVQHRLMWTDDLKNEVPYRTDVTGLFNTYTDKFCTGQLNPYSDDAWAAYKKELSDATYDKWLVVIQDVLKNSHAHGVK